MKRAGSADRAIARIITAFTPLVLTPALRWAIANGSLNFGGGEKDIILLVPWIIWSIGFATAALVCWRRHVRPAPTILWALAWATGILLVFALAFALLAPKLFGTPTTPG